MSHATPKEKLRRLMKTVDAAGRKHRSRAESLAGSSHPQIVETRAIAEGKAIAYENVLAALRGCWTELEIDS